MVSKVVMAFFNKEPDVNLIAELNFLGKVYPVSAFSASLSQSIDEKGEPEGEVRGGKIQLKLSQLPDDLLLRWAGSRWMRKNGELVFKNETGSSPFRVAFTDAACVEFRQETNMGKGSYTSLLISAKELSFNGILMESGWVE